jgi:hypothetical protein
LIHQFMRLVTAAGGFGEALDVLKDIAQGVFDYIKGQALALPPSLAAVWNDIKAGFMSMAQGIAEIWADLLHTIADGVRGVPGLEDVHLSIGGAAIKAGSAVHSLGEAYGEAKDRAAELREEADRFRTEGADSLAASIARLREIMQTGVDPDGPDAPRGGVGSGLDGEPNIAPGVGGAGSVKDDLEARLEAVRQGLLNEQEVINEWYEAGLATLIEARERGLITEQEFMEQRERLEDEHQNRLNEIRKRASEAEIQMRKQTHDAAVGLLQQFGQRSRAAAVAAVALNAAQRVQEISANTAAAQVRALAELGPIAGPPAAAKIGAFGMAQKAIAVASAALRAGASGGSSGGASAGGAAARGGGGQTQQVISPQITITPVFEGGGGMYTEQQVVDALNRAARAGLRVDREVMA